MTRRFTLSRASLKVFWQVLSIFLVIGGFIIFLMLLAVPWIGDAESWPMIEDTDKILQECQALLMKQGVVLEGEWPVSVKRLNPLAVTVHGDHVNICISSGGIGPGWGFKVYPDRRPTIEPTSGETQAGTVCPGIFKYKTDW